MTAQDVCKRCGDERPGDTSCSRCGGFGLLTGYGGDAEDCWECGGAGVTWPPRCPGCAAFRSTVGHAYDGETRSFR